MAPSPFDLALKLIGYAAQRSPISTDTTVKRIPNKQGHENLEDIQVGKHITGGWRYGPLLPLATRLRFPGLVGPVGWRWRWSVDVGNENNVAEGVVIGNRNTVAVRNTAGWEEALAKSRDERHSRRR